MSDVYSSHPLYNTLGLLLARRENDEFGMSSIIEDRALSRSRDRIFAVASLVDNGLKATPDALISIPLLDQMDSHWRVVLSEVQSFGDEEGANHLRAAALYIDSHIQPLLSTLLLGSSNDAKAAGFPEMMREQAKYAEQTLNNYKQMSELSITQVEHIGTEVYHIKEWIREAGATLMQQKIDVENAVSRFQQAFEEGEAKRALASARLLEVFREDAQAREDESKTQTLNHVEYLREQKAEAARLVELIGEIGVTGNYQKIADKEKKEADFWRWGAVAFFGAGVVLAFATFFAHWQDEVTVESALSILVKLLYAVIITTPAWYAAKESARHRTNADRARQAELELASIGPFIELMPEAKKVEIREHLSKLYFGRSVESHNVESFIDGKTFKEMMIEIVKAIKPDEKNK